ncbi:MAG: hypothetical protein ACREGR_04595 [Minisyncoccia bacterium]
MIDSETQKNIAALMAEAPTTIRSFLLSKLGPAVESLMKKNKLHVDQADVLERELLLLLLSVNTPAEFTENLKNEAHMNGAVLMAVLSDVNSEIFTPIDAEMRAASKAAPEPAGKPEPVVPVLAQKPPIAPTLQPVARPGPPSNLPGTPLADALKRAGAMPMTAGGSPMPVSPKPATLLEDHEEPHINMDTVKPAAATLGGKPVWNAPRPVVPTVPTPAAPMTKPQMPAQMPIPANAAPPTPKPPIVKEYGVDPYREPLDEK